MRAKGFEETCRKVEIQETRSFYLFHCMELFRYYIVHKYVIMTQKFLCYMQTYILIRSLSFNILLYI
jgi:hypothetical protein